MIFKCQGCKHSPCEEYQWRRLLGLLWSRSPKRKIPPRLKQEILICLWFLDSLETKIYWIAQHGWKGSELREVKGNESLGVGVLSPRQRRASPEPVPELRSESVAKSNGEWWAGYSQSYTNTASHGPHRPSKNLCSSSAEQCLCNSSSFCLKSDDIWLEVINSFWVRLSSLVCASNSCSIFPRLSSFFKSWHKDKVSLSHY